MSEATVLSGGGTSSVIDFLKTNSGSYLYPITLIDSVYNLSGVSLQSILDNKQPIGDYALSTHNHDSIYSKLGHTHTIANISGLQNALDGKQAAGSYAANHTHNYIPINSAFLTNVASGQYIFMSNNVDFATSAGAKNGIEIRGNSDACDAILTFHIPNKFACQFGLDATTSRLSVGGWSFGNNSYDVYNRNYPQVAIQSGAPSAGVGNERLWAY